jgi:hypothetical protein
VVQLVRFHVVMSEMQDITNRVRINACKVVFVNVVMHGELIKEVNVFLIGDVN